MSTCLHGPPKVSKRQLKLSGQTYAEQTKRLEKHLSVQLEELALTEQSLRIKRAREQVLADLIATQEVTLSLLEQHQHWLDVLAAEDGMQALQDTGPVAVPSSTPSRATGYQMFSQQIAVYNKKHGSSNQSSQDFEAAAEAAASAAPKPTAQQQQQQRQQVSERQGHMSYVALLLANATPQQLRQVLSMTADDWQQYKHDHFLRLVALLELVNRPLSYEECEGFEGQDAAMQAAIEQQQQQQADPSTGSGCAPTTGSGTRSSSTATAAAPVTGVTAAAAADPSGLQIFDIPGRFKAVVDEGITLSFLALFFNHLTIMNASANKDLPQQVAPPGFWLRVVKKLNLTEQQLLQLRLASEEFARLNKSSAAQGEALLNRANCPNLFLAAEASIQAAASSYAITTSGADAGSEGSAVTPGATDNSSGGRTFSGETAPAAAVHQATGAPGRSAAAAVQLGQSEAAAAADDADEEQEACGQQLDALLQRHLRLRFLYMVMIGMFVFNTLTRVQIAQMTVGCYPYYPMLTAVAEAAALIHKQQEKEHEQRIRARRRKQQLEIDDFNDDQQQQLDDDDDDDDSSGYAKQQLQLHQQQRALLLQLQQQFWQQQIEVHQKRMRLFGQQQQQ